MTVTNQPRYRRSVNPDDMVQVTLAGQWCIKKFNALAWVTTTKGTELYKAKAVPDSTATAMTTALQNQTLGGCIQFKHYRIEHLFRNGASLDKVEFIDSAGGVILLSGWSQNANAGGTSAYYNLDVSGLALPITKGSA